MNNQIEMKQMLQSRANLYALLSRFYQREMDDAFLKKLAALQFAKGQKGNELLEGCAQLAAYLQGMSADTGEELAVDYARIFLAAGIAQGEAAFPYESVYTSKKRIVMQDAWDAVRAVYRDKGVTCSDKELMEDHIGCELDFMAHLCREAAEAEDANRSLMEQRTFLQEHLLNWIPAFTADVEKYAQTDFYRAAAKMTRGFLAMEQELLAALLDGGEQGECDAAGYRVSRVRMNELLAKLQEKYTIYAPKRFMTGAGDKAETIKYAAVTSFDEIVTDRQSDFSPKEAYYPISQTMFYFTESEVIESSVKDDRGILIFARPCDINAMERLDNIFLRNGGQEDLYYARLRGKVKIVMLECSQSFEHCFCVSLGTNKTDNYQMAVRAGDADVLVQVKDAELAALFAGEEVSDFAPEFVTENKRKLHIPDIKDRETLKKVSELDYWKQFDDNCIGCGGCNTVCGTCSCFDTVDIIYNEGSRDGERRRVWSSCMLEDFTQTAGGARARKTPGANMRFKVLHKFYDYRARFDGEKHMCVGCGRCTRRCPKDIDFFETVNGLADLVEGGEL